MRISKKHKKNYINVPHFSDIAMYSDPIHVKFFSYNSFKALTGDSKWSYYTEARYEIVSLKIILKSLFKLIGVEFIINAKKNQKNQFNKKVYGITLAFYYRRKNN